MVMKPLNIKLFFMNPWQQLPINDRNKFLKKNKKTRFNSFQWVLINYRRFQIQPRLVKLSIIMSTFLFLYVLYIFNNEISSSSVQWFINKPPEFLHLGPMKLKPKPRAFALHFDIHGNIQQAQPLELSYDKKHWAKSHKDTWTEKLAKHNLNRKKKFADPFGEGECVPQYDWQLLALLIWLL